LGYKQPIILCSKTPHNDLQDIISKRFSNIVILTDYDAEGLLLNKKLTILFEKTGPKVNGFYRGKIQRLLRKINIFTIEGIYNIKKASFF
jgi:5S rRNA maturation endonuclease (ribonuclease M5)